MAELLDEEDGLRLVAALDDVSATEWRQVMSLLIRFTLYRCTR